MGSPLDDLRKISNQVEKKRSETAKELAVKNQTAKEELARVTREQRLERQREEALAGKRSEKLKFFLIIAGFSTAALLIFLLVYFMFFGGGDVAGNIQLVSDGFSEMPPNDPQYPEVTAFALKVVERDDHDESETPWYHALPASGRERFGNILRRKKSDAVFKPVQASKDEETGCFHVFLRSDIGTSLVINIVSGENGKLAVTRIY